MTLTIDLSPQEEARLNAARQQGLDPAALFKQFLAQLGAAPVSAAQAGLIPQRAVREALLVEEYHALLDREDRGGLSQAQQMRLQHIEAELNRLEDEDPIEQAADRRVRETGDKLDEILALLRSLPRKDIAG